MSIRPYRNTLPQIHPSAYIDESAVVIGDVTVGEDSSFWPTAVARGDVERIVIGNRTNIQDGSVLHVTHDGPYSPGGRSLIIGDGVTVGHRVTLHACTIGNHCLIGMAALVMDNVVIGEESLIAGGSVVPPGKVVPPRTLWRGNPAREVRALTDAEVENQHYSADHYIKIKNYYHQ
nr:protein YrdA-like [Nerophis lumbriciformis]